MSETNLAITDCDGLLPMKRAFFLRFVFCLFAFAAMISAIAAEGQTEKLRVAISSISTSQVNVWVPLDAGFFKKHGLDVELVYISGAPVGTAALMSGEVAISQGGVVARSNPISKGREPTSFSAVRTASRISSSFPRASNSSPISRESDSPFRASAPPTIQRQCSFCRNSASSRIKN